MHPELRRRLALVAPVMGEDLEDIALLELLDGVGVGDTGAVHLENETVKFALQDHLTYGGTGMELCTYCRLIVAV